MDSSFGRSSTCGRMRRWWGRCEGGSGVLKVSLTDAPACGYDNVWVTVTKVRVHRSDTAGDSDSGWSEVVVDPSERGRKIDLLELQNGVLADLGQTALPSGHYSQVRLVLADNATVSRLPMSWCCRIRRQACSLDTPSAQQSGLKLKHGFDVEDGAEADLVLDFDACRSIVKAGNSGKYNSEARDLGPADPHRLGRRDSRSAGRAGEAQPCRCNGSILPPGGSRWCRCDDGESRRNLDAVPGAGIAC